MGRFSPTLRPGRPAIGLRIAALAVLVASCGGDDNGAAPPPPDTVPPAAVGDLVAAEDGDAVMLTWSAPGDDGTTGRAERYDIRVDNRPVTAARWDSTDALPDVPSPKPAGEPESLRVDGLSDGTWHFALRAADEVPNWSGVSNGASATVSTAAAPEPVADLAVCWGTLESLTLNWTAPDAASESARAAVYELRMAAAPIDAATWEDATPVGPLAAPGDPGAAESFVVGGLDAETERWFAIRSASADGTWSRISNPAEGATSRLRRLTFSEPAQWVSDPAWSPTGDTIAFVANWDGDADLYVTALGCGEPVRLTDDPAEDRFPAWSPDGRALAFCSPRSGAEPELCVLRLDGAEAQTIATHPEGIWHCSWSPDGERIVYQSRRIWTLLEPTDLWIVPSNGGAPEWIFGDDDYVSGWPDWSPDGSSLVFISGRGYRWDIWLLPLDSRIPVRLPASCTQTQSPVWSRDGTRIAYTCDAKIWSMAADGGDRREHATGYLPTWSPDGGRLAFSVFDAGSSSSDVWVLYLE